MSELSQLMNSTTATEKDRLCNNLLSLNGACATIEGDFVWPCSAVAVRGGIGGRAHFGVCSGAASGHERRLVHPASRALHHDPACVGLVWRDGARSRPPAGAGCEPGAQWAFGVASGDGEVSRAVSSSHRAEDQFAAAPGARASRGRGGRGRDTEGYLAARALLAVGVGRAPCGELRDRSRGKVKLISVGVRVRGGGGAGSREPSSRFLRSEGGPAKQDSV